MKKKTLIGILTGIIIFGFAVIGWTAEPIKVGTPLCLTGPYAADGVGYYRGVEMAVNDINAAGGLLGKPLEIVKFDILEEDLHKNNFFYQRLIFYLFELLNQYQF